MANKSNFRIVRQGYDRFEVDQHILTLLREQALLRKQNQVYKEQIEALFEQRDLQKKRYSKLASEISVRERAAEEMSRRALSEANFIVDTAQKNADLIIREAMSISRQVLVEIARISNESNELRDELKDKIKDLEMVLDGLDLPDSPNLNSISDDQDTLD